MTDKFIIGIDLGGTNLKIALFNLRYQIIEKRVLPTRRFRRKDGLIAAIADSADKMRLDYKLRTCAILGVGLGLPGLVDVKRGIVHFLPNIPGWKEVPLKKILEKRLRLPVFIDNDAKLMSLAESRMGAAKGKRVALCLTLGTGVGAGIVIENNLYRGVNYATAEIGHLPINENGPRCNCGGIACLEAYIGNRRIRQQARKIFQRNISLEDLSLLAKKGNRRAFRIWEEVGARLGRALVGAVNLLNPDCIVIGGGVAGAGEILFQKVRKVIARQAMRVQAKDVKVFRARLGSDAGLIGAAILVKEELP